MRRKLSFKWPLKIIEKRAVSAEKDLLKRAKKGDNEAFGKLYVKYLDPIYRHIYFRVNQKREDAEDLAEIVFFKAWDHMSGYRVNGKSFKAWLYTIAHNTVIDHYRKSRNFTGLHEGIEDSKPELIEAVVRKEENHHLFRAINNLTQEQKQVIELKFIEGLPNREIAKILAKNEIAIRALQHRALIKLKKQLKGKL